MPVILTSFQDPSQSDISSEVWDCKLGNRSGLEWMLDQYKKKKLRDPTVAAKFNTYRFANYKDQVINLLTHATRVSVETMAITEAMKGRSGMLARLYRMCAGRLTRSMVFSSSLPPTP